MATPKCIKACRCGQEVQLFFSPNVRMGEGMRHLAEVTLTVEWLLVPDWVVWVSQKRLVSWGFHTQQCLDLAENVVKNKKTSSEQLFCRQKHVVNWRDQRRSAWLVKADRKVTVTQITTHYNSGMQKSISEHTTRQISKWTGYSSRSIINT